MKIIIDIPEKSYEDIVELDNTYCCPEYLFYELFESVQIGQPHDEELLLMQQEIYRASYQTTDDSHRLVKLDDVQEIIDTYY